VAPLPAPVPCQVVIHPGNSGQDPPVQGYSTPAAEDPPICPKARAVKGGTKEGTGVVSTDTARTYPNPLISEGGM
jgi:hypothetical protein